ncbi:MAG: ABC transporter permease [Promicromonosporaceae bacterium]|nr:ABC transporter permease [Promicromonosporaceae bacterium]
MVVELYGDEIGGADGGVVRVHHEPNLVELPEEDQVAPLEEAVLPNSRWSDAFQEITSGGPAVGLGALILALAVGSLMIAFTNTAVREAASFFFARPGDTFSALGNAIMGAYSQLIRGSIFNWRATGFANQITPFMNTLDNATPLIVGGLGLALTFKAGLFNIGGRGQMILGIIGAGWFVIALRNVLPLFVSLPLALIVAMATGGLWGALAGWLKAKTGAHEVISTIMLNFIAFYLLQYLLATPGLLQAPGGINPVTLAPSGAVFPHLFGSQFRPRWSFVLALGLVALVWWLLNRSALGFQFRAVGENPRAARVAGINVSRTTILAMAISGGLLGLAGLFQLGTITGGFTDSIDAGIGFDAITVALLGGSSPIGVLFAGLLFGAFRAGGATLQAGQGIPPEIVQVIQSLIVLFIAAPPLVRTIFHLPSPTRVADRRRARLEAAQAAAAANAGLTERVVVQ